MADLTSINREFEEKATSERAQSMGMSYIDIAKIPLNPDHLRTITLQEATDALAIPFFKVGKKLRLAIAHPTRTETQALIRKLKEDGYSINVNLASEVGIRESFLAYKALEIPHPIEEENLIDEEKIASYQQEIQNLGQLKEKITNVTAEEALNFINIGALKTGASDIHYQPEEKDVLVRFRIDGVLQAIFHVDFGTYRYISNQLKYKSGMKLNISNVPQDGRFNFKVNDRKVDVRVSSIPTEYGESLVCRLLDSKTKNLALESLGYEGRSLEILKRSLELQNGMILVTGPTGSGKTTTLYSLLNSFNQPENKIITLEDPIEYHLSGVTQSQINEKRGYTFAAGLRAILRQDPDVVMIGEIRDKDTAETASQASLTGHVVLSTLHTNSAVECIPRLINIGLTPFMVAPALSVVVAQRLARKICPYCAEQRPLANSEKELLSKFMPQVFPTLPVGKGCDRCNQTGFLGQIAIAEVLEVNDELKSAILNNVPLPQLIEIARKSGMITMFEDGIQKVLKGLTSISELKRVTEQSSDRLEVAPPSP